jgi:hypothetical protein
VATRSCGRSAGQHHHQIDRDFIFEERDDVVVVIAVVIVALIVVVLSVRVVTLQEPG